MPSRAWDSSVEYVKGEVEGYVSMPSRAWDSSKDIQCIFRNYSGFNALAGLRFIRFRSRTERRNNVSMPSRAWDSSGSEVIYCKEDFGFNALAGLRFIKPGTGWIVQRLCFNALAGLRFISKNIQYFANLLKSFVHMHFGFIALTFYTLILSHN